MIRHLLASTAIVAAFAAPAIAFAQTAPSETAAEPQAAQASTIDDVIVTAERRSQSLQRVPSAISAFNSEMLERAGVVNLNDIASRTPSFVIGQQGPSSPDLSIRGIGSSDRDAGSDRSVIAFVDEVYTGRAGSIPTDLFDLERVEVLRGPQGTLYGKNTVGGAINLITRKPTWDFDALGEVTVGTHELLEFKAAVGGGISETLAGRLTVAARSQGPMYRNLFLNRDTDDLQLGTIRGQLLWRPSDSVDVLFSADAAHDEVDGITTHIDPATPALLATGFTPDPDPFTGYQNVPGFLDRDVHGGSVRVDWRTPLGTVTSLTAGRSLDMAETRDLVGIPLRTGPRGFESTQIMTEESSIFSQELRLTSNENGGPVSWIVGAYYSKEDVARVEERKRQLNAAISRPRFDQTATTTSYAVFGQAVWAVTDRLNITAGGRYTVDKKDFGLTVTNPFGYASLSPATQVFSATGSDSWNAFTPKVTVDYTLMDDVMLYGTVSQGFKSGGFQGLAANAAAARTSFNPEHATNYEIGLKSRFLDRRATLNLAAFRMDFTDLQFRQRILTIPGDQGSAIVVVANAGTAELSGVELESSFRVTDWLTLNAAYSYLDATITQFNVTAGVTDVNGRPLARAPNNTFAGSVDMSWPVGDGLVIGARAEYRYRSSFWFEPSIDPALLEDGYGLVDARVSISTEDRSWVLEGWVKNATDEQYRTFAQAVGFATAGTSAATSRTGDPLTAGVTLRWRL